jgi:hypothetical protein
MSSNSIQKRGEKMKNPIMSIICAATASVLLAQTTSAGPVTFVVEKTAHFVHKAGQKIDQHVIEPGRRAIVNHTPRPRTVHRSG